MFIYIKHCIFLHIINKYWTSSCPYPCTYDTILHKIPTIALYILTALYSRRYAAICFSPQRAVLRGADKLHDSGQQNACPDVNIRLKSSVLCVTWQLSNCERCKITKVGLKVSVLPDCTSCESLEQIRLVSIDYYWSVSIFTYYFCYRLLSTATLVTLVTNVVSKVSRPSRQVPDVRFQPNFNFLVNFITKKIANIQFHESSPFRGPRRSVGAEGQVDVAASFRSLTNATPGLPHPKPFWALSTCTP
jgi:hypothetical protein